MTLSEAPDVSSDSRTATRREVGAVRGCCVAPWTSAGSEDPFAVEVGGEACESVVTDPGTMVVMANWGQPELESQTLPVPS